VRRAREARVRPVDDSPERFHAVLYVDGLRSDWSCCHRHLHPEGAMACIPTVEADADSYLNGPGFTEQNTGIAAAGLWSGPVEVLRHMEWSVGSGCRVRRRVFVLGSDRAMHSYLSQRALGGRLTLPGSPRGDHLDRRAEHTDNPAAESGDQPEVL